MTQEERTLHKNLESKLNRRGLVSSEWAAIKSLRAKYLIDRGEDPNEWNKNQRTMSHKSIAGDLENKTTNQ